MEFVISMGKILKITAITLSIFIIISCGNSNNNKKASNIEETTTERPIDNVNNSKNEISPNISRYEFTKSVGNKPKMMGTHTLGNVGSGEVVVGNFAVLNKIDKTIIILEISSNCGCLTIDYTKEPIKANDTRLLKCTYNTKGKFGKQYSQVTIKTTEGNYMMLIELNIK